MKSEQAVKQRPSFWLCTGSYLIRITGSTIWLWRAYQSGFLHLSPRCVAIIGKKQQRTIDIGLMWAVHCWCTRIVYVSDKCVLFCPWCFSVCRFCWTDHCWTVGSMALPFNCLALLMFLVTNIELTLSWVITREIHDFVNFNAFTFICEGFKVLSAAFVQILLFAMCHTWALDYLESWLSIYICSKYLFFRNFKYRLLFDRFLSLH